MHNLYMLCVLAELEGGAVVESIEDATHAVLRHQAQDEFQQAMEIGTVSVVRPEWVIHCTATHSMQDEVGPYQECSP